MILLRDVLQTRAAPGGPPTAGALSAAPRPGRPASRHTAIPSDVTSDARHGDVRWRAVPALSTVAEGGRSERRVVPAGLCGTIPPVRSEQRTALVRVCHQTII